MSQVVHFQLLPRSTCGHERRRQGTLPTQRAANYSTPPSCAFKLQQKSLCIGERLGSTGFRRVSEDRKQRRLVVVNVAASERIAGGASYERVCDCLVYPSSEKSGRTKGLVHFLGGAFIGAAPDVIYRYVCVCVWMDICSVHITCTALGFKVCGCYSVRFSRFPTFTRLYLHSETCVCISKSTMKHQQEVDWKPDLSWLSYCYQKSMFADFLPDYIGPLNCVQYRLWGS